MNYKEYLTSIGFAQSAVEKLLKTERIVAKRNRALRNRVLREMEIAGMDINTATSLQTKLHCKCIQYQYDVLYYKYGKEKADEIMAPNRPGHFTFRQAFRVFKLQRPLSKDYKSAKENLKECIKRLEEIYKRETNKKYEKNEKKIYEILNEFGDERKAIDIMDKKYKEYGENTHIKPSKMNGLSMVYELIEKIKK